MWEPAPSPACTGMNHSPSIKTKQRCQDKASLTSILLCPDLGLQVFGVDILVVFIVVGRLTLPAAETEAAAAAEARGQSTAQNQALRGSTRKKTEPVLKTAFSQHAQINEQLTTWNVWASWMCGATGRLIGPC